MRRSGARRSTVLCVVMHCLFCVGHALAFEFTMSASASNSPMLGLGALSFCAGCDACPCVELGGLGRCLVASDQACAASLNGGGPRISMPPFFFAEA